MNMEQEALKREVESEAVGGIDEAVDVEFEEVDPGPDQGGSFFDFIFKRSKDVPLEDYEEHPLNLMKSEGNGQVVRGVEGLFGDLHFAVVDIFVGLIKMWKDSKGSGVAEW